MSAYLALTMTVVPMHAALTLMVVISVSAWKDMRAVDSNAQVGNAPNIKGTNMLTSNSIDIDECGRSTGICGNGGECLNSPGNYSCWCSDGYRLEDDNCTG